MELIQERQGNTHTPCKDKETKKSSMGTDPPAAKVRSRVAGQAGRQLQRGFGRESPQQVVRKTRDSFEGTVKSTVAEVWLVQEVETFHIA